MPRLPPPRRSLARPPAKTASSASSFHPPSATWSRTGTNSWPRLGRPCGSCAADAPWSSSKWTCAGASPRSNRSARRPCDTAWRRSNAAALTSSACWENATAGCPARRRIRRHCSMRKVGSRARWPNAASPNWKSSTACSTTPTWPGAPSSTSAIPDTRSPAAATIGRRTQPSPLARRRSKER